MGSSFLGVEPPNTCPEVSNTAQDRSYLTSVIMLTHPSALGGEDLIGLAVRMGIEWLPGDGALGSCPFALDCRMSADRSVGSPLSIVMPLANDSGGDIITGISHLLNPTG